MNSDGNNSQIEARVHKLDGLCTLVVYVSYCAMKR